MCSTPSSCRRERQIRPHSASTCALLRSTRRSHFATNQPTPTPLPSLPARLPPPTFLHRPTPYTVRQGNELLVLSGLRRTLRTWRPLIFFENNQMGAASLAAVEAMLSTAPLNYICTRGLQDTLCVHAERRQQRNVGTNLNLTRLNLLRGDRRAPGDADNRPLSRGSSELNHNISQRVKYIRNASRRECLRAPERGTVGGGKNVRRAAAWLGLQAVPRCSLRADQAWAVRVGLLEREVTESDVAMACDGRVTAPRASQDGADRARGVREGQ